MEFQSLLQIAIRSPTHLYACTKPQGPMHITMSNNSLSKTQKAFLGKMIPFETFPGINIWNRCGPFNTQTTDESPQHIITSQISTKQSTHPNIWNWNSIDQIYTTNINRGSLFGHFKNIEFWLHKPLSQCFSDHETIKIAFRKPGAGMIQNVVMYWN